jgi:predicted dehydrogenase
MRPVGLGLVGVGMWGRKMAAAAERAGGVGLVTCFARDEAARLDAAQAFRCRAADSLDTLLDDSDVEAVLVVTPNHTHAEIAVAAAERGRHVFVEKPIADSLADGLRAAEASQRAGVLLFVGHSFRGLGAARAAATAIGEGALGEIVLAEANFSLPGAFAPGSWRSRRETLPAGPMTQLGVHHADTLQAWIGPAISVMGSMTHMAAAAEIDDVAVALLEHASGARSGLVQLCLPQDVPDPGLRHAGEPRLPDRDVDLAGGRTDGRSHDAHDRRRHGFGRSAVRAVRHAGR